MNSNCEQLFVLKGVSSRRPYRLCFKKEIWMIVVVVCNVYSGTNNGTTVSCRNFVKQLRLRGYEVRVITTGEPEDGLYIVPAYSHNLAATIASWNGIAFGKPDEEVIARAGRSGRGAYVHTVPSGEEGSQDGDGEAHPLHGSLPRAAGGRNLQPGS